MDKLQLKRSLVEECIRFERSSAENFIHMMEEALQSAEEYGQPEDWFDSYKTDMLNKRDMYGQQLEKVKSEIQALEKIDLSKLTEEVTFGSVVVTDQQVVFVSVGIGKVQFNDERYYAISPNVPFFKAMSGLKKGDSFLFRDKKVKILDVF